MRKLKTNEKRFLIDVGYTVAMAIPLAVFVLLLLRYAVIGNVEFLELVEAAWIAYLGIKCVCQLSRIEQRLFREMIREKV